MSFKAFLSTKKPSKSNFRIKDDFIAAVRLGELLKIEKIFKKPDFIEQMKEPIRDEEGNSMLLLAIKSAHREVFVRLLQDLKVDINVPDANGATPLHLVSEKGWIECVNLLLKFGANTNLADNKENLPIHRAAENGRMDVISLFLNQNIPVDAPGELKGTPLLKAAHNNHYDCVVFLLDKKADVNAANSVGVTPLLAALAGTGDKKLIEKLILAGADATVVDVTDGKGALHYAAKYNKHECMNAVVQAGALVSGVDKNGMTPLHDAGLKSCRHCINLLLLLGCDVKARDVNGSTPLHHLVTIGDPTSANMLLSFGADIDAKDNEGMTPLAIALRYKRKTIAKLLIDKGASTDFLADESNQGLISQNVLLMITAKDEKDLKFSKDKTAKGPQIRAATVDQLVYRLTYELHPDVRYQKIFLLTYRAFMTPKDLLNRIIARFLIEPPKEKQNPEALKTWQKSIKLPVQLRVINLLRSWIENHFRDFYPDTELLERLIEFLEKEINDDAMKKLAAQLIKLARASEEEYKRKEETKQNESKIISPRERGPSKSLNVIGEVNMILNIEPEQLAKQLCLIEFDLYSALQPKEFLNQAWNKGTVEVKDRNAPNIRAMIANSNKITMWVASEVVQCRDMNTRAEVVNRLIRVAKALYDLNNFNGLVEVLSGFSIAAVNRLSKTWALVKMRKQLESLREVTHPDKNFLKLREHVHNSNPPIIPYLGTYLSDLTFIDEGNPNTVVEDGIELINFFKQRLSAEFILEVQQYQQQGYNFERDAALINYLQQCHPLGEKEMFDLSLEVEPREKTPN